MGKQENALINSFVSSGLQKVGTSIYITNKIINSITPTPITDPLEFWNSLNKNWKILFLYQLVPESEKRKDFLYYKNYLHCEHILEMMNDDSMLCVDVNTINSILNLESFEYLIASSDVSNLDLPKIDTLGPFNHLSKLRKLKLSNFIYQHPKLFADLENGIGFENRITELYVSHDDEGFWFDKLKHFKNLVKLRYFGFREPDFDGIEVFEKLEVLSVNCDCISDLHPLGNLKNLRELNLCSTNDIPNLLNQIDSLRKTLPNCIIK